MDHPIQTDGFDDSTPGTIMVPDVLPIFPLQGVVLLPGEVLPLHIFEQRYRDMVRDAIAGHRVIGMVESLPAEGDHDIGMAEIRQTGCVGFIAQHQELPDGRFLLWLLGLERFRVDQELETGSSYRNVRVTYDPAEHSAQRLAGIQPVRRELRSLLPALLDADTSVRESLASQLDEVSDTQLIALACQILELPAERKQRILEAESQTNRFMMVYEDVYRHLDLNPADDAFEGATLN